MSARTTQIFVSYASEDGLIATAIETAFSTLAEDAAYPLSIIRDVHSFQYGRSIKGSIHDMLHESDILFIIYSEQLKKSHSFTGYEVGIFSEIMDTEIRSTGHTDRSIVSLFLSEPPPTETETLGIKLDAEALEGGGLLDSSGALQSFLGNLSDMMVKRQFDALNPGGITGDEATRFDKAKHVKREYIRTKIVATLESNLRGALSSVVASNFIEQNFIQLRWEPSPDSNIAVIDDKTVLSSDNAKVFDIFGISTARSRITWKEFKDMLEAKDQAKRVKNAKFITDALQNAVSSAFSEGPVDNNQIFLTYEKKICRVIVTRYNVFFDGGRVMNIYFIPFLDIRDSNDADHALIFLQILLRFRGDFLHKNAPFRIDQFDLYDYDFGGFVNLARRAMRSLQVTLADSHNCGLDDPGNFRKFFGEDKQTSGSDISQMYSVGEAATTKMLQMNAKFNSTAFAAADERGLITEWSEALKGYIEYAQEVNLNLGKRTLGRIGNWFETGALD
jgi:hypothetical protein